METINTGILVGLLTEEQKNQLVGQEYAPDSYFNPIQDANNNWVISLEEITDCDFLWVKELTLIEYISKKPIEFTQPTIDPATDYQEAEIISEEVNNSINPNTI
jgi:hypothetical protein